LKVVLTATGDLVGLGVDTTVQRKRLDECDERIADGILTGRGPWLLVVLVVAGVVEQALGVKFTKGKTSGELSDRLVRKW
jgi:hypothetical protein